MSLSFQGRHTAISPFNSVIDCGTAINVLLRSDAFKQINLQMSLLSWEDHVLETNLEELLVWMCLQ